MRNRKAFALLPIILIVAALIVIGGGYYIYQRMHGVSQNQATGTSPTSTTDEGTTATSSEAVQPQTPVVWKTYRNNDLGFEAQYPSNWSASTSTLPNFASFRLPDDMYTTTEKGSSVPLSIPIP